MDVSGYMLDNILLNIKNNMTFLLSILLKNVRECIKYIKLHLYNWDVFNTHPKFFYLKE